MLLTLARVLLPKYPRCYKHITAIKRACPLVQHIKPLHTHSNMELNQTHKQHLEDIDTFMFDCDGVLWDASAQAVEGAVETLALLRSLGKRIFFVTNNSSKTRKQYAERCALLGFQAAENEIVCTAWLIAAYLKDVLKFEGKAYVIGGPAMAAEFENKGIPCSGPGVEDYGDSKGYATYLDMELDPDVGAVAVGFDPFINYVKVMKAASYIQRPGCHYVATNLDSYFPSKGDKRIPGTGSLVNFVSTAAEKDPLVVGKPNTLAREILEATHGKFNLERTMMVGDRLNTDMMFGNSCGFKTLFVLTGVNTVADMQKYMSSNSIEHQKLVPTYYAASVGSLKDLLQK